MRHDPEPASLPDRDAEIANVLTVDVEDYFQVSAFERTIHRDDWHRCDCRVERNTHDVLEMLDRCGIKATFFVLGWIAERYPALVRKIHDRGHEIGSHGYWHRLIYSQTPDEFRDDLRHSRAVLADACGCSITAYRAPSFSITHKSLWALDILAEEGFLVDSSIFPVRHDRYGMPDAPKSLHRVQTNFGPIWEFPPSVARVGRWNLPCSGGGYFRLFPLEFTLHCLRRINRREATPFMFYFHPWEIDPGQPRIKGSHLSRFRHYVNLASTRRKLEKLFACFRFTRMCDVIESQVLKHGSALPLVEHSEPPVAAGGSHAR